MARTAHVPPVTGANSLTFSISRNSSSSFVPSAPLIFSLNSCKKSKHKYFLSLKRVKQNTVKVSWLCCFDFKLGPFWKPLGANKTVKGLAGQTGLHGL